MRLAVTGLEGQVVKSLLERGLAAGHEICAVGRPDLDLATSGADAVFSSLASVKPDVIVSAAAYTNVDRAETEPDLAFAVNAKGPENLAKAAQKLEVPLIHLSTDYVFAGEGERPFREDDTTGPKGVYGASKLAGERAVLETHPNSAVLRTAWVYSPFGRNFIKTMLHLAQDRSEISVVADQIGNPTSALDIADAILTIAGNLAGSADHSLRGLFHMAGTGETSWAGLAEAIFEESAARGGPYAQVVKIATTDYPTPAQRPANSRLDCNKLAATHGVQLPAWRSSVATTVSRLLETRTDGQN